MIANGSIDGSAKERSFVATSLTQSVEPGRVTSSTATPPARNQPISVAIANGAAAALTVRAQNPRGSWWSVPRPAQKREIPLGPVVRRCDLFLSPRSSNVGQASHGVGVL